MKKELSNHLSEKWILYLVSCVLISLLVSWGVRLCGEPNKKEKVTVFVASYSSDTNGLYDKLNSNLGDYLKKVELNAYNIDDEYFYVYVQVYLNDADIVIMPASLLERYGRPKSIDLTGVTIDGVVDENAEYYIDDERGKLGFKIHKSGDTDDYFSKYFTFTTTDDEGNIVDEDYYLFIKADSLHMGEYSNATLDGGLTVLKELFKDEN